MSKDQLIINSLRFLSAEMIEEAKSGHPGMPLGATPMTYTLWSRHLRFNPEDKDWPGRDRFVLSVGHGSALLYSLLYIYGYISLEDIKEFRQVESLTPGHPEYEITPGVEASTGPLGQGIGMAVGMAIAESQMAARFNKEDISLFDNYTYTLCGDGDLMEGMSYEALSLAGTLKLDKLIVLYDSNNITIEGTTDNVFDEDVCARMEAFGFQVLKVEDGNDTEAIDQAIRQAQAEKEKPSFIEIRTQIGYGAGTVAGSEISHGAPLGEENIKAMRDFYNWDYDKFDVDDQVFEEASRQVEEKKVFYQDWMDKLDRYKERYPQDYKALKSFLDKSLDEDIFKEEYFKTDGSEATRVTSGKALNKIARKCEYIVGGSADLGTSNKSIIEDSDTYRPDNRSGRNLRFGVREHAMGAIGNGLTLYGGVKVYMATFLVFTDYMKAAMRMAGLMKLPNIYLMTHDSVGVGEDGPTHQPIEHLAMLRSIPNMDVIRPADANETYYAWKYAMESEDTPVTLALTRQDVPILENTGPGLEKGAYILAEAENDLEAIIIASGSELCLALNAKERLESEGIGTRIVSMPSMNIFDRQSEDYKESVLPKDIRKRVTVEAGATFGWDRYAGIDGITIGIDSFGISGKADEVFEYFGITSDRIYEAVKSL